MDIFGLIADRKIEEAMAEGEFRNLVGQGQPLDLSEDPHEDPASRMANRLLKNNGFAPPWIEESREIEAERAALATELHRATRQFDANGDPEAYQQCLAVLRSQAAALNRRISGFNFKAPAPSRKLPVDLA